MISTNINYAYYQLDEIKQYFYWRTNIRKQNYIPGFYAFFRLYVNELSVLVEKNTPEEAIRILDWLEKEAKKAGERPKYLRYVHSAKTSIAIAHNAKTGDLDIDTKKYTKEEKTEILRRLNIFV